jgi:hypothetical protein
VKVPLDSFPDPEMLEAQHKVCKRYGVPHVPTRPDLKIAISFDEASFPINGLREREDPAYDQLSGWWIWSAERDFSAGEDAFDALHLVHVRDRCPEVMQYLGLPPGWRFLIAPGHEDAWYDNSLVEPQN